MGAQNCCYTVQSLRVGVQVITLCIIKEGHQEVAPYALLIFAYRRQQYVFIFY